MNEDDSRQSAFVPLPLLQFIDRTLGEERRSTDAEFRRCDALIEGHARAEDLRHQAADARIQKSNEVLDYRLKEMNNFREQINQERADYLRREMYERDHAVLAERVKNLEIVRGEQAGRTAAYASMVGAVVIFMQIALHFWK